MNPTPDDLKALRAKYGVTQQNVADLLYLSVNTVAKWENGVNQMPRDRWEHLNFKLSGDQFKGFGGSEYIGHQD